MSPRQAARRSHAWGDKHCDHPLVEPMGCFGFVDVCAQCGRVVQRRGSGSPAYSRSPKQAWLRSLLGRD